MCADYSTGTLITTNIADDIACPGEKLVYTCVSQGTSQRWRIVNAGGMLSAEQVFGSGHRPGSAYSQNVYNFTLISTVYNHFESMLSAMATASIHNSVAECRGTSGMTLRDEVTLQITGFCICFCVILCVHTQHTLLVTPTLLLTVRFHNQILHRSSMLVSQIVD